MNTPKAKMIMHSRSGEHELITMVLTLPKCLMAEINTHRSFSSSSASSRAIPHKKFREGVEKYPFIPEFMRHETGMAANEPLAEQGKARQIWQAALNDTLAAHRALSDLGVSKGQTNRLLEPFFYTEAIRTGTKETWEAFFRLRVSPAAQKELHEVALEAKNVLEASTPVEQNYHIPFCVNDDDITARIVCAVVSCARISYLNHEGVSDPLEKLVDRFNSLYELSHLSPFEHIAVVGKVDEAKRFGANFNSFGKQPFCQLRKIIECGGPDLIAEFFEGFNPEILKIGEGSGDKKKKP